ncbi:heme-degrading domain-containing protein [Alsobacter sp. SYSU M60028]|uniref:Heme-degrading domain-containing protein n=1 Tax=Alsobacter ponti TaxID=2962936 RepID=A0ABT1LAB8_9HYPH|nr:heme-degrading domain-containing protein [Alsobacter ponti]MCP8937883.1 heme-degrading domain-containing protein [Alsobacter ponti]
MADSPTTTALLDEEAELQFPYFNADVAWRIGVLLREEAALGNLPVSIEVAMGGHPLFFCAMPGASPDNAGWVRRKRATAERFLHSSLYVTQLCVERGRGFERYSLPPQDYAASGGSVPVSVRGTGMVGTVTISGLTQYEDHAMAARAIRTVIAELERA